MVIGIIGENCTGKSTLAEAVQATIGGRIVTGKDYLRLAKSESMATMLFRKKLKESLNGENLIYVISEREHIALLPDGTVKILVTAELDVIKARFRERMRGNLPAPVAAMLEKKHGMFEEGDYHFRFDGTKDDISEICGKIREMIG